MSLSLPRVVGHRGAARRAPENTLAGLRKARELGCTWVEFDVKLTADRQLILMHDDTLDRTTNGRGPVAQTALAEIRELDAGAWFDPSFLGERVPTFEQAVSLLAELDLGANIEIKPCPGRERETARAVAAATRALWPSHLPEPILSSFSIASLAAANSEAPELLRGLLVVTPMPDWRKQLRDLDCIGLHAAHDKLTPDVAQAVKREGFLLMAFTVNDLPRARTLWSWGVDSVHSDAPDLLLSSAP
ncbi:MAG: glycerophosphodiester phosphodiesterase [Planctomycetota bacterium]|nr:MAG: glycerophosphodiester phosphodiesterase [Planctomycetota bacterium]